MLYTIIICMHMHVVNVQTSFFFNQHTYMHTHQIKLVNIHNDGIVDGRANQILGLVWTLILHFQASVVTYVRTYITSQCSSSSFADAMQCLYDHFCIVSDHAKLRFSSHRHNVSPAAN